MNIRNKIIATAVGALSLCGTATASFAGSEIQPGISAGLPIGAPLPEGLYVIELPNYGYRNSVPGQSVGAIVPAWTIWSTPWTLLGGRVLFDVATPIANVNVHGVFNRGGLANPLVEAQLKWDLGNGFFGGFHAGAYLPIRDDVTLLEIAHNYASFQGIAALSYLKDGWNLSGTFMFGNGQSGSALIPGSWGTSYYNLDLTATKQFGGFEIGAVAFSSADLSSPFAGYAKQSQFAAGGLIGYHFANHVSIQFKLTRDVTETNYGGYDTRGWANVIIPLWAPTPAPVVAAKY